MKTIYIIFSILLLSCSKIPSENLLEPNPNDYRVVSCNKKIIELQNCNGNIKKIRNVHKLEIEPGRYFPLQDIYRYSIYSNF